MSDSPLRLNPSLLVSSGSVSSGSVPSGLVILGLLISSLVFFFERTSFAGNGVPHLLPFQGRLTDSSGQAINAASKVAFRIYAANTDCYLYEEVQDVTPNAYGIFSTLLGSPANSTGPANHFKQVFNNDPSTGLADSCGQIFYPSSNEWRRLQILINGEALPGMQTVGASAYAIHSQYLEGYQASDFLKLNSNLTQLNVENLVNGSEASHLHHHDGRYLRLGANIPINGNISSSGSISMTSASSQLLIGDASAPASADIDIEKISPTVRLGSLSGGGGTSKIEFYSGATIQRASIQSSESSNVLSFYTGTVEALRINQAQDAFFSGSLSTTGVVSLGKYDSASEATLLLTLGLMGPAGVGSVWMNSSTGNLKYWNGSQAITLGSAAVSNISAGTGITITGTVADPIVNVVYGSVAGTAIQGNAIFGGDLSGTYGALSVDKIKGISLDFSTPLTDGQILKYDATLTSWVAGSAPTFSGMTSLNGLSGSSQTLAVGTAGGSPVFSSVGTTHTLNIPQASSGASVTGGLLSNAEYNSFIKNDGSVVFTGHQNLGSKKIINLADPTLAQDAATKTYVDTKLATRTLASAAPSTGQMLGWNGSQWEPTTLTTSISSLNGLASSAQTFAVGAGGNSPGFASSAATHTLNIPQASSSGTVTAGLLSNSEYINLVKKDGTVVFTANQSLGGKNLINVADPLLTQDAATKNYVDTKLATRTLSTTAPSAGQVIGWSGTQWRPTTLGSSLSSLNGLSTATQTFAIGTTGTAPAFNSGASTHRLNIPMASAGATVTAGLVSNTEYINLVKKNAANIWSAGTQDFTAATSLKVPASAGAAPTASGLIAYDTTANQWKAGVNGVTHHLVQASSALTSGNLIQGGGNGAVSASTYTVVAVGTAGVAASNTGTATTLARSDHVHRVFYTLNWFFSGTPLPGSQSARMLVPQGVSNCVISNSQLTVNTTASTNSTYNIERCGGASCAAPASIYGTARTLSSATETIIGGAPTTSTISAGDAFRVNFGSIGTGLANVSVSLTYKCQITN